MFETISWAHGSSAPSATSLRARPAATLSLQAPAGASGRAWLRCGAARGDGPIQRRTARL